MTKRAIRRLALASVAMTALPIASAGGAAAAPAPLSAPGFVGGGWLATPPALQHAHVTFTVPTVQCRPNAAGTLSIGLVGHLLYGRQARKWAGAVIARCENAHARYTLGFGTNPRTAGGMRVSPGDLVEISGDGIEIDLSDETTGQGEGEAIGSSGPLRPDRRVLFGAVLRGAFAAPVKVTLRSCRANGHTLGAIPRHRIAENRAGSRVVRAGALVDDRSFPLFIS